MKRYIRSDQYIPDMTERFPEGRDGVDLTDSYFPSRGYSSDEDAIWDAMADDYYSALEDRVKRWQSMTDEELENLSKEEYEEYIDDMEEWNEYNASEGPQWERQWKSPKFDKKIDKDIMTVEGIAVDGAGEAAGTYGSFTYGGYWVQLGDDSNYNEAHFDDVSEVDKYLQENGLYKEDLQ